MITRLFILSLLSIAFAIESGFAHAQTQFKNRFSLSGEIEENNGKLRLYLSNDSIREFRGRIVIGIGSDTEQKEIGQLSLEIPALATRLLQFAGVSAAGSFYSLKTFDENDAPVFFKIAPIKTINDSTPATVVKLSPVKKPMGKGGNDIAELTTNAPPSLPGRTGETTAPAPEITIKTRLVAGDNENDPFKISFEMTARRPINEATLAITIGKHKDRKPISISRNLTTDFKLPEDLESERIEYVLTAKDGREIAKGEFELGQLMAEDHVNVSDVRTDRPSYEFGETVKLTIVLEGQSPHGYRIEVALRDANGMVTFTDQRQSKGEKQESSQEFTILLPRTGESPITLDFKVYDAETGLLFDSGEREIPISKSDQ